MKHAVDYSSVQILNFNSRKAVIDNKLFVTKLEIVKLIV